LAGTNDVFALKDSLSTISNFASDYQDLLSVLLENKIKPVVTLIPYQLNKENTALIDSMNAKIVELARKSDIPTINLNNTISKNGKLLEKYTIDGVHISQEVYTIWGEMLKNCIKPKIIK